MGNVDFLTWQHLQTCCYKICCINNWKLETSKISDSLLGDWKIRDIRNLSVCFGSIKGLEIQNIEFCVRPRIDYRKRKWLVRLELSSRLTMPFSGRHPWPLGSKVTFLVLNTRMVKPMGSQRQDTSRTTGTGRCQLQSRLLTKAALFPPFTLTIQHRWWVPGIDPTGVFWTCPTMNWETWTETAKPTFAISTTLPKTIVTFTGTELVHWTGSGSLLSRHRSERFTDDMEEKCKKKKQFLQPERMMWTEKCKMIE